MGRTRKFEDDRTGGAPESKKHHRPADTSKSQRSNKSVNPLKKRIRDINRVLNNVKKLSSEHRIDLERENRTLEHEVQEARSAYRKARMIKKYHMVRFFERRKAERHLKAAQKRLDTATSPEEVAAARNDIHTAKVDLNYTTHFPLNLPYVSLFPNKVGDNEEKPVDDGIGQARGRGDVEMWHRVEECTANKTLDKLRNGFLVKNRSTANAHRPSSDTKAKNRLKVEDDDSDGGFFEEA